METDSGTLPETGRRIQQLSAARYAAEFRARAGLRLYLLVFAVPLEWLSASLHFHNLLVNYVVALAACASAALPSDLMLFGLFILAWSLGMSPTVTAALGLVSVLCRLLLTSSALGLLMGRVPAISTYSSEWVRKQWHRRLSLVMLVLSGLLALLSFPFSRLYGALSDLAYRLRGEVHVDVSQLYAMVLIGIVTVLTVGLRWARKRFRIGEPAYDELLEEAFWFLLTLFVALVPAALAASWQPTLLASVAVPFTVLRMRWYRKLHGEETAAGGNPGERSWRRIVDAAVGRQQRLTELGVVRRHAREAVNRALDEALFAPLGAGAGELSEQEARQCVESAIDEATRRLRSELAEVLPQVWALPREFIESEPVAADEVSGTGAPPFDRELGVIEEYERYLIQREAASATLRIAGKNMARSGESLLIASGREARLFSYPGLTERHRFTVGKRRRPARSVALSSAADLIAVGLRDHIQLHTPDGPLPGGRLAHRGNVTAVAFSPDGEFLAASSTEHLVRVWNVADKSLRYEFTRQVSFPAVCFSGDGRLLAVAATDGRVYLLDAATGELQRAFVHAPGPMSAALFAVALSPDGRLLLSGGIDGEAKLWDIEAGRCLGTSWTLANLQPATATSAVWAVAFSPDGSLFAVAKWGTVTVWSTVTREHVLTVFLDKDPFPRDIAFTPLGDAIAVQTGKALRLYGIPAGIPARLIMLTADGFAAEPPELVQAQSLLASGHLEEALDLCAQWRRAQGTPVSGIDSIDEDLTNLSYLDARLPADGARSWELIAHAVRHGVSDGALWTMLRRARALRAGTAAAATLRQRLREAGLDEQAYPITSSFTAGAAGDGQSAQVILQNPMQAIAQNPTATSWDAIVMGIWASQITSLALDQVLPSLNRRRSFYAQVTNLLAVLQSAADQPLPWWVRMHLSASLWDYERLAEEFKGRVRNRGSGERIRAVRRRLIGLQPVVTEHVLRAQDGAGSAVIRHLQEETPLPDDVSARLWMY